MEMNRARMDKSKVSSAYRKGEERPDGARGVRSVTYPVSPIVST